MQTVTEKLKKNSFGCDQSSGQSWATAALAVTETGGQRAAVELGKVLKQGNVCQGNNTYFAPLGLHLGRPGGAAGWGWRKRLQQLGTSGKLV